MKMASRGHAWGYAVACAGQVTCVFHVGQAVQCSFCGKRPPCIRESHAPIALLICSVTCKLLLVRFGVFARTRSSTQGASANTRDVPLTARVREQSFYNCKGVQAPASTSSCAISSTSAFLAKNSSSCSTPLSAESGAGTCFVNSCPMRASV